MSEEASKPSVPKQKKVIKIGSQRPGYVPDEPKQKNKPVQPPARPTKDAPKFRVAADPQASAAPAAESSPSESTQTNTAAMDVAPEPVEVAVETVEVATQAANLVTEPDPEPLAEPVAQDATPVAVTAAETPTEIAAEIPAPVDLPAEDVSRIRLDGIKLDMTDEELEQEIAAAMGENVERLMAGEVSTAPEEEVAIDGRYQATVLRILRDSVLFELPGPYNGAIPLRHFESPPAAGTEFEIVVVGFSPDEQMYDCMIPGGSVEVLDWSDVQEGVVVEATITGHNKGGLECEVNRIRGFIPISQVALYRVDDLEGYVGQKLQCVVNEANPERQNLVLSHRAVLERERAAEREKQLAELAVGQIHEGTVTRLQNFGAFVDLGGIDGLIHISQLSWDNIRHPSEVVAEGQHVRVRIDKFDAETGKIGLSYRDLMHHPWEGIDAKYPIGAVVMGTVSKIMDFGAFVKLESGVEGLVHISELSHKRVNRVSHVVEEGQRVEVKILAVDAESQKISLSMKAALGDAPTDESVMEDDEPTIKHVPKTPPKMLKGGTGSRKSDGDQFGLKW